MLNSIYLIGKEISQGRDPWEDILVGVKLQDKASNPNRYLFAVNFNLDTAKVEIDGEGLFIYSDELSYRKKWCSLKIQGGNNKSIYLTVDAGKLEQLQKTLFGKNENAGKGELIDAIEKEGMDLEKSMPLGAILQNIFVLRTDFLEYLQEEGNSGEKLTLKKIRNILKLGQEQQLVQLTATVTSTPHGLNRAFIGDLEPYRDFISRKFFGEGNKGQEESRGKDHGLCYASGRQSSDIVGPDFFGRYNINKYFVQTTQNYATGFEGANYRRNYQLSAEALKCLDRGSDYLLKNAITTIAGIKHIVIPEFFCQNQMNIRELGKLNQTLELMFQSARWEAIYTYLVDNTEEKIGAYAINLLAIDSDGNYFKAGNLIRDVSSLFLQELFRRLSEVGKKYSPWLGNSFGFNLYSVYRSIPVRKKESINRAFFLMQSILEQRPIERRLLFDYFKELVLCYKYGRYKAYENIVERKQEYYHFAIRDAVFTYQALLETLFQLHLLSEQQIPIQMEISKTIGQEEDDFLRDLAFSNDQAALFYLGRVLNRVVYEQSRKGHKKNALDKLNFNGMDGQAIFRLANELFEAGRHYDITQKIVWPWGEFSRRFRLEGWVMNPAEALYYILCGFAFRMRAEQPENEEV
ncbi:MAG: hypothetical protein IPN20_00050 [Haliscomenobacter sp.]|nr:hypothetical protein [Haliscomenobacter sp.]